MGEQNSNTPGSGADRISRRRVLQTTAALGLGSVHSVTTSTARPSGGDLRWSFETGSAVDSSPTVIDDTVFVGSEDGHVYALDATDGTERWAFDTGHSVDSSPTVVDGTVFVKGQFTVYALDAAEGTERWTFETGRSVSSSPTVVDGTVFVGSWDAHVYALDAAEGTEQ